MLGEQETSIRTKNEGLLKLTEERVKSLEKTLEEKSGICEKQHQQIIDGLLLENRRIKDALVNLPLKLGDEEHSPSDEQYEELKAYANELHELLIGAKAEIKVRKEQMNDVIEQHTKQIEQITNTHMQNFIKYRNDIDDEISQLKKENQILREKNKNLNDEGHKQTYEKLKKEMTETKNQVDSCLKEVKEVAEKAQTEISNQIRNLKKCSDAKKQTKGKADNQKDKTSQENNTSDEFTSLRNELETLKEIYKPQNEESSKEIQSLREEIKKLAEIQYKNIEKTVSPPKQNQGLPNNINNTCYMRATIHALATTLREEVIYGEKDNVTELLGEAKDCIKGKKSEEEAANTMTKIWEYSKEKWPEFERNMNGSNQEDAGEYMARIIEESEVLKKQFETTIQYTTECKNPDCENMQIKQRIKQYVNIITIDVEKPTITLQELVNDNLLHDEPNKCRSCGKDNATMKQIIKEPNMLLMNFDRCPVYNMNKTESEVTCQNSTIQIYVNKKPVTYAVTGVIIHKGSQMEVGHYVFNHNSNILKRWTQIDNNNIITRNMVKEDNKQGQIFILRKIEQNMPKDNSQENKNKTENETHSHQLNEKLEFTESNLAPLTIINRNRSNSVRNRSNSVRNWSNSQKDENTRRPRQSKIPCLYYKLGQCKEGDDCQFLHHVCRFYLAGNCKFDEDCRYRHGVKDPTRGSKVYENQNQRRQTQEY